MKQQEKQGEKDKEIEKETTQNATKTATILWRFLLAILTIKLEILKDVCHFGPPTEVTAKIITNKNYSEIFFVKNYECHT